jgi:glycolate oxidase FAD binding subunit
MADQSAALREAIAEAIASHRPVYIRGGDSKRHLCGRACGARALDVGGHRGIVDYQPDELMLSARAGTPLLELEQALAEHDQVLPFEPPHFAGRATLGGTLACNLSGPARPWWGSVRDAVLGVQLITGQAQLLNFGGKVMKNVAGYDVSRLQAGALGTLGLITEVHLKVLPRPQATRTLAFEVSPDQAVETLCRHASQPKPLTGACWVDGRLFLRLAGAERAVEHTAKRWGGETTDARIWQQLRELEHPFFAGDAPLWRLSTAPGTPLAEETDQCVDWGGAQRWLRGDVAARSLPAGSQLCLFAGGDRSSEVRGALDPVQQRLQQRLKNAFDPAGIFNPGRLYSWMT